METLDDFCCDDDIAVPAFAERGIEVDTVNWRAEIDWGRYDLVIVRSTWDYHCDIDAFLQKLAVIDGSGCVLANPLGLMRRNIDKRYLRDLERQGIVIVPSVFGDSLDSRELTRLRQRFGRTGLVIKPLVSGGAYRTLRLTADADVAETAAALDAHGQSPWLAQPFLPAVQDEGEYSLFYFGGEFSHAIVKTAVAGDFRVQEEYGGRIVATAPSGSLLDTAAAVMATLTTPTLYARVDLIRHDDRLKLMELELIEPSLYLRTCPGAAERFADASLAWLGDYSPRKSSAVSTQR
ncbi:MAG: hypothetical protein AAFX58_13510 [Pseudomonadota bacterium]